MNSCSTHQLQERKHDLDKAALLSPHGGRLRHAQHHRHRRVSCAALAAAAAVPAAAAAAARRHGLWQRRQRRVDGVNARLLGSFLSHALLLCLDVFPVEHIRAPGCCWVCV
eukprot:365836-Chlamydomonas_euryale.AAC.2